MSISCAMSGLIPRRSPLSVLIAVLATVDSKFHLLSSVQLAYIDVHRDILNRHQRDVRCRPPDSEPAASFAGNGHPVVQSSPAWHDSNSDDPPALPLTSNQAHQAQRSTRSSAAPKDTTADVRDTNPTLSTFQAHRTSSSSGIPPPVSRINTPQLPNTHRGVMEDVALPSSFPNISDCFPNWNVNPDLHDDILEMDFPPFDYVWTPEQ
jgi:hypothetical protein